jgi:hypothetical protein
MALYRFHLRHQSRVDKASAGGYAKYLGAEQSVSQEGYHGYLTRSQSARDDLIHAEHGNMPQWATHDPQHFWAQADAKVAKGRAVYSEMIATLPRELSHEQNVEIARDFVKAHLGDRYPYTWAMHEPNASDSERHPHVHIMFNTRRVDDGIDRGPEQFFKYHKVDRPERSGAPNDYQQWAWKKTLYELRESWATHTNEALQRAGIAARVSHQPRDYEGMERPVPYLSRHDYENLRQTLKGMDTQARPVWRHEGNLRAAEIDSLRDSGRLNPEQGEWLGARRHNQLAKVIDAQVQDAIQDVKQERFEKARAERETVSLDQPVVGNRHSQTDHIAGHQNDGDIYPRHQGHVVTQREAQEAGDRRTQNVHDGRGVETPMQAQLERGNDAREAMRQGYEAGREPERMVDIWLPDDREGVTAQPQRRRKIQQKQEVDLER